MKRVMSMNQDAGLVAMALMISNIPNTTNFQPEALVTLPGMGEKHRVDLVLDLWDNKNYSSARALLIPGASEKIDDNFSDRAKQYTSGDYEDIYNSPYAANTLEQMSWIMAKTEELDIDSIILYAPAYHLIRAYLTLIKSMLKVGRFIAVVPQALVVSPYNPVPLANNTPAWQLIPSEVARIIAYQKKGDVASIDELVDYLAFLYNILEINLQI